MSLVAAVAAALPPAQAPYGSRAACARTDRATSSASALARATSIARRPPLLETRKAGATTSASAVLREWHSR